MTIRTIIRQGLLFVDLVHQGDLLLGGLVAGKQSWVYFFIVFFLLHLPLYHIHSHLWTLSYFCRRGRHEDTDGGCTHAGRDDSYDIIAYQDWLVDSVDYLLPFLEYIYII
jgi:hypothetical protein